jgi:hypothetical protein
VSPRADLDTEARGKILSPLPGTEPRSPGRPTRSQTLTELPGSRILISYSMKFSNIKKFRYGIPAYTGFLRALHPGEVPNHGWVQADLYY